MALVANLATIVNEKVTNMATDATAPVWQHPAMADGSKSQATKKPLGEVLKAWREHKDLTQGQVAQMAGAGVNKTRISRYESGDRRISFDWLERLARVFDVSIDRFREGPPDGKDPFSPLLVPDEPPYASDYSAALTIRPPAPRDLPVRGRAVAGSEGAIMLAEDPPIDWITRPASLDGVRDAFALYVNDWSMATAGLRPSTIIHVHPHRRPRPDDFVVVVKKSGEALIKRFVKISGGKVIVKQTDPPLEISIPADEVRSLFEVVGAEF